MLSIVIPTLNEEKYLPKLLDSVKKQTYTDYEIIVSDSGSKDNTVKIARKFGCKVFKYKNGSPAKGRNRGANLAKGQILVFMDADGELLDENFLSDIVDKFNNSQLVCCTCKYLPSSNKLSFRFAFFVLNILLTLAQYVFPSACGYFIACKKQTHIDILGFDETIYIGEDSNYVQRASRHGKFWVVHQYIRTSTRRYEKEGAIVSIWKSFYLLLHRLFIGEIRNKKFSYTFGDF